jgi:hypothetical protein
MNAVEHTASFTLPHSIEQVFPLFTPEGEKLWAPGWDYHNLMDSSEPSEDYVFLTESHDHAGAEAIWLVKRYEPANGRVAYYRVEPGDKVGVVTVQCTSLESGGTKVEVTYRYTPLSEKGQAFVDDYTSDAHQTFIVHWRELLMAYFEVADGPSTGGSHAR